ncbi:MAG: hypothetical protein QM800_08525 [Paludibacter sp.]
MKKFFFLLALTVSMFGSDLNAQVKGKAIGIRLANEAHGGEISFQSALSRSNRLELDLGFNNWYERYHGYGPGFELTGVYQWVWGLNQIATGLNFYAGLGGTIGTYNPNFGLGVVGQLGLEYNFNIPLQISLDWRPTILNTYYTYYGGNGLSIRYRF